MGNRFPAPEKHVECGKTDKLAYAFCEMQGYRAEMEDGHTIAPAIDNDDTRAFFGIYDGHSGNGTSQLAGQHLLKFVLEAKKKKLAATKTSGDMSDDDDDEGRGGVGAEGTRDCLWKSAFLAFDTELRKIEKTFAKDPFYEDFEDEAEEGSGQTGNGGDAAGNGVSGSDDKNSVAAVSRLLEGMSKAEAEELARRIGGSTAVTVYMQRTPQNDGWEITCANIGDSRAVLYHREKAIPLSDDHKPSNPQEKARIENAGGFVVGDRVDGNLALSRAFGDFIYKDENLGPQETKVIAIPDVTRRIVKDEDTFPISFIVIACDGIWDVFSNEHLEKTIRHYMDEIGLFNPEAPVPEKFLRPGREMWIDKLVPDWNEDDLTGWMDTYHLSAKGDWVLHEFFAKARETGEFSERVFDDVVSKANIQNPRRMQDIAEVKKAIFERIHAQEKLLNNIPPPPTSVEGKLQLVAKKIVDDAVFAMRSMDNISLTIVLLLNERHSPDTLITRTVIVSDEEPN